MSALSLVGLKLLQAHNLLSTPRHVYLCIGCSALGHQKCISVSVGLKCFAGMLDRKVRDYSRTCDAYVDMLGTDKGCCSQEQAMPHMQPIECASHCHTLKAQGLFAILIPWQLRQLSLLLQFCAQYPCSMGHPEEVSQGRAAQSQ